MLRFLHPQELIFGRSTPQKRTNWFPKLVIYLPVQSWFRNSEVLCKTASHPVHCHFEKSAVNGGKRRRGEPGRVGVHKWYSDFPVIPVGTGKEEYVWRFPSFRKLSSKMSCTIWISNRNFRFLLTNGKRPYFYPRFSQSHSREYSAVYSTTNFTTWLTRQQTNT